MTTRANGDRDATAVEVLSSALVEGKFYAYRENARDWSLPFVKVQFVGLTRRGQARVRWVDGELADLEEWVPTRLIMCRWGVRKSLVRDHERQAALVAQFSSGHNNVTEGAVNAVMAATCDPDVTGIDRTLATTVDGWRRVWSRAGLKGDPTHEPGTYVNRDGSVIVGFDVALRWAQAIAAAEPQTIALYLDADEAAWRAAGFEVGRGSAHAVLRMSQPAHALVRQWMGRGDLEHLRDEVTRLRGLLRLTLAALDNDDAKARQRMRDKITRGLRDGDRPQNGETVSR